MDSLEAFMDFPTRRERVLRSGQTLAGVIPEICLVSHFQVGSWEVLYRPRLTGNVRRWGLPLMIPNFSRLKDGRFLEKGTTLPIHGFGRLLPWSVTAQDETHLALELRSNEATRTSYPYEFTFHVEISVAEGVLTYTLNMENHSTEPLPIAPGFHPYFSVAQADKARLEVSGLAGFSAAAIDWETAPPDTPYPFAREVTIRFPQAGTLTIAEIAQDGQYALKNIQVWTELPTRPDHAFVCFEPTVGSEDALNRPGDRLEIAPGAARQIMLQLRACEGM
jgi:galactose mutarotase-like enzyme